MNAFIQKHFQEIELRLLESPIVNRYEHIRQEIAPTDGKIRIKAYLIDGGLIECFEYVTESLGTVTVNKYSFHWQNQQGVLQRRWDNVPHHPQVAGAPHHVHVDDQTVQESQPLPTIFEVFQYIEKHFQQHGFIR